MRLSVLGFGCGAGRRFMCAAILPSRKRTIARAIEAGVNYFDTAGSTATASREKQPCRVLQRLKPANAAVGTKVGCRPQTSAASPTPSRRR